MHVLIAGCGWLGTAVAAALLERGHRVTGARRDPGRAEALRAQGIQPLALDLSEPEAAARIPGDVDAILALQSARESTVDAYTRAYLHTGEALLEAARKLGVRALVFAGSTGVFGQRDGSEVDEATPPAPASPTTEVLARAERMILDSGLPARIVRLSGLYGPGRTWMIDHVRSGTLALGPGEEAWLNSCHRDDAAAAILAALVRGRDGGIYHGTDAEPLRRGEVVRHIAARLGIPAPTAPGGRAWAGPDRRVRGGRTREELGLEMRWPSLKEGLEPLFPR